MSRLSMHAPFPGPIGEAARLAVWYCFGAAWVAFLLLTFADGEPWATRDIYRRVTKGRTA